MESEMLKLLREYFKNTPRDIVNAHWLEVKNMGIESPNAFQFLAESNDGYCFYPSSYYVVNDNKQNLKNTTPKYSESFFCVNLQYE